MTKSQMVKTLTRIMEQDDHQSMLAVSHGGCFNFLRAAQDPHRGAEKGIR